MDNAQAKSKMSPTQKAPKLRNRDRADLAKFGDLIATPGNLVVGVSLPANCTLFASTSSVLAVASVAIDINARTVSLPIGAANAVHKFGGVERGRRITKATGAPGTVSVYIADGFGKPILIAQG